MEVPSVESSSLNDKLQDKEASVFMSSSDSLNDNLNSAYILDFNTDYEGDLGYRDLNNRLFDYSNVEDSVETNCLNNIYDTNSTNIGDTPKDEQFDRTHSVLINSSFAFADGSCIETNMINAHHFDPSSKLSGSWPIHEATEEDTLKENCEILIGDVNRILNSDDEGEIYSDRSCLKEWNAFENVAADFTLISPERNGSCSPGEYSLSCEDSLPESYSPSIPIPVNRVDSEKENINPVNRVDSVEENITTPVFEPKELSCDGASNLSERESDALEFEKISISTPFNIIYNPDDERERTARSSNSCHILLSSEPASAEVVETISKSSSRILIDHYVEEVGIQGAVESGSQNSYEYDKKLCDPDEMIEGLNCSKEFEKDCQHNKINDADLQNLETKALSSTFDDDETFQESPTEPPLANPQCGEMITCQDFANDVNFSVRKEIGDLSKPIVGACGITDIARPSQIVTNVTDNVDCLDGEEHSADDIIATGKSTDDKLKLNDDAEVVDLKNKQSESKDEPGKIAGKKSKKKKGKKNAKRDISKSGSSSPPSAPPQSDSVQRKILKRGQQWSQKKNGSIDEETLEQTENVKDENQSPFTGRPLRNEDISDTRPEICIDDVCSVATEGGIDHVQVESAELFPILIEDLVLEIINEAIVRSFGKEDCDSSSSTVALPSSAISSIQEDDVALKEDETSRSLEIIVSETSEDGPDEMLLKLKNEVSAEVAPLPALTCTMESNSTIAPDDVYFIKSESVSNSLKIGGRCGSLPHLDSIVDILTNESSEVVSFDATLSIVAPSLPIREYVSDDSSSSSSSSRRSSCSQKRAVTICDNPADDAASLIVANSNSIVDCIDNEYVCLNGTLAVTKGVIEDRVAVTTTGDAGKYCDSYQSDVTISLFTEKRNSSSTCDTILASPILTRIDNEAGLGDEILDAASKEVDEEQSSTVQEKLVDDDSLKNQSIKEQIERIIGERLQLKVDEGIPVRNEDVQKTRPCSQNQKGFKDSILMEMKIDVNQGGRPCRSKYNKIKKSRRRHLNLPQLKSDKISDEVPREGPWDPLNLTFISDKENSSSQLDSSKDDSSDDKLKNTSRGIIHRWSTLESKATDRQRQSSQLRQLQRQIKNVKLNLESVSDRCSALAHPHSMALPSQLQQKVEEAKNLLDEAEKLKVDLSSLNVVIHRFIVDVGSPVSPLKEEVTELYRLFDEIHRRVSEEIARFENAEATWRLWEEHKQQLMDVLKQDKETLKILDTAIDTGRISESITASVQDVAKLLNQKRKSLNDRGDFDSSLLNNSQVLDSSEQLEQKVPGESLEENRDDHLSDSGTSGYESCSSDDLSERERRLAYLRRLARDLEANLAPGSKAWSDVCLTLSQAEKELRGLQNQCQNLILKTAETFEMGTLKSGLAQNSCKRRSWTRENKRVLRPDKKRIGRGNRGWISRVARAAVPFQVALLLLFCVACLLEPNCCDSVNTFNLSFSPQLRYVHGAAPV